MHSILETDISSMRVRSRRNRPVTGANPTGIDFGKDRLKVVTHSTMSSAAAPQILKSNKSKMEIDSFLPFIILPILLLVATLSRTVTIIIMVTISMGVLYVYSRPWQKNRSPFFFSWTISSAGCMFIIFEFVIMPYMLISAWENRIFLFLLACTGYFFHKMKSNADLELTGLTKGRDNNSPVLTSESQFCKICQIEVNEQFFHSIWWDCCVLRHNYPYFLAGHACALATLLFGTNLGLTTVCQPATLVGPILIPHECKKEVYDLFETAICFVTSTYGVGYLVVVTLVLLHQLIVYMPKYRQYCPNRTPPLAP